MSDAIRGQAFGRLMLVTDRKRARGRDLVRLVAEAVAGGVGIVQVREKDLPDTELRALVRQLRAAVPPETRLSVNGRERVAATERCGLHLPAAAPALARGQPPWRGRLPLVGRSAHDEDEARRAADEGADYIVLGTVYATPSKPGLAAGGPELVRRVLAEVPGLPIFAIGGVTVARIPELVHAGAYGVAVCGALVATNDPRRVAQAMSLALEVATRGEPAR